MNKLTALCALALMAAAAAGPAHAEEQRGDHPRLSAEERAQLKAMTPEQRRAWRQKKAEERIAALPPEQQAQARERWARRQAHWQERRARWEAMSPAEREKFKAEHRGHGREGHRGEAHEGWGHGEGRWAEGSRHGGRHHGRHGRWGHDATPEQRAAREQHRARRKAFVESLTPQQQAEFKALHQEGRELNGGRQHGGWSHGGNTNNDAKWAGLTPEERAQAQAMRDKWLSVLDRK